MKKQCYSVFGPTYGKYIFYDKESSEQEYIKSGCRWIPYTRNIISKKITKSNCKTFCDDKYKPKVRSSSKKPTIKYTQNKHKHKHKHKHKKCYATNGTKKNKYILYDKEYTINEYLNGDCDIKFHKQNIIVKKLQKSTCKKCAFRKSASKNPIQ
jgi:hypothetical protein